MSALTALTVVHVAISLVGIATGFVIAYGLLTSQNLPRWTAVFLATTILTSATGFLFPFHGVTPGIVIGVLSLLVLAPAVYARYARHMEGHWRTVYVVTALVAFYFNFFVLIAQSFKQIPTLHALAPTQTELPFVLAQLVALIAFLTVGILATLRFRPLPLKAIHA